MTRAGLPGDLVHTPKEIASFSNPVHAYSMHNACTVPRRLEEHDVSNWVEDIPSVESYALNKVLFDLHHQPSHLQSYQADAQGYLNQSPLSAPIKEALLKNDVAQLYLKGANPYLLRAHCIGVGIPEKESVQALKSLLTQPPQDQAHQHAPA